MIDRDPSGLRLPPIALGLLWTFLPGCSNRPTNSGGARTEPKGAIIAVTNPKLYFSPYNWYSDGNGSLTAANIHSSSTFAWSNMPGAYLRIAMRASGGGYVKLNLDTEMLSGIQPENCPTISWSVDKGEPESLLLVASKEPIQATLASELKAGPHTIDLFFRSVGLSTPTAMGDRWETPASRVNVTGIEIDRASSLIGPSLHSGKMLVYGDSISEGADSKGKSNSNSDQDATETYAMKLAAALDCEVGIVGNSYQGYQAVGSGNFPEFPSTWDSYSRGKSRLVSNKLSPAPDYILDALGTNDDKRDQARQQALFTRQIASYRAAGGPKAKIFMIVPPGGATRIAKAAATQAAKDRGCYLLDAGPDFASTLASGGANTNDGVHPNANGQAQFGKALLLLVQSAMQGSSSKRGVIQ